MLAITQAAAGLGQFWNSLTDEQKGLFDKVLQFGLGPVASQVFNLPDEVSTILCSDLGSAEKFARCSQHLPEITKAVKPVEQPEGAFVSCPLCSGTFFHKLNKEV